MEDASGTFWFFWVPNESKTDHLIGMKFGTGILDDDDMNHLKNKRIRSVADLLQDQFGLALGRLQHEVQTKHSGKGQENTQFMDCQHI